MISTKELRDKVVTLGSNYLTDEEWIEVIGRLEAAEKERDWHAERCEDAMNECARLRSKIEAIERQEPVKYEKRIKLRSKHTWGAWWECDKSAYVKAKAAGGHYPKFSDDLLDYEMRPLYTLPGAQNVPKEAIAKILTEAMNIAVANGANSISMPDEYVEVAAWLCGMPTQNVPNVSENYFGMTLHDKIEAMENKL